jgi:hypothetical protein
MDDKLERRLKELSGNFSRGAEEIREIPVRMAGVSTDIRSEHIPYKHLELYPYMRVIELFKN